MCTCRVHSTFLLSCQTNFKRKKLSFGLTQFFTPPLSLQKEQSRPRLSSPYFSPSGRPRRQRKRATTALLARFLIVWPPIHTQNHVSATPRCTHYLAAITRRTLEHTYERPRPRQTGRRAARPTPSMHTRVYTGHERNTEQMRLIGCLWTHTREKNARTRATELWRSAHARTPQVHAHAHRMARTPYLAYSFFLDEKNGDNSSIV